MVFHRKGLLLWHQWFCKDWWKRCKMQLDSAQGTRVWSNYSTKMFGVTPLLLKDWWKAWVEEFEVIIPQKCLVWLHCGGLALANAWQGHKTCNQSNHGLSWEGQTQIQVEYKYKNNTNTCIEYKCKCKEPFNISQSLQPKPLWIKSTTKTQTITGRIKIINRIIKKIKKNHKY